MNFAIRSYHPSDLPALYRICLVTVFGGAEAIAQYTDPDLLGHFYAAPYAVLEPELCFVLTSDGAPCGYVLGTRDTASFRQACELEWLRVLRQRYPLPPETDMSRDAAMIRLIHAGQPSGVAFPDHPAHLHIDLLPHAQGGGWGRKLMTHFLGALRSSGVRGVHLGVGARNVGAVKFYERLGFHLLYEGDGTLWYGMTLESSGTALQLELQPE